MIRHRLCFWPWCVASPIAASCSVENNSLSTVTKLAWRFSASRRSRWLSKEGRERFWAYCLWLAVWCQICFLLSNSTLFFRYLTIWSGRIPSASESVFEILFSFSSKHVQCSSSILIKINSVLIYKKWGNLQSVGVSLFIFIPRTVHCSSLASLQIPEKMFHCIGLKEHFCYMNRLKRSDWWWRHDKDHSCCRPPTRMCDEKHVVERNKKGLLKFVLLLKHFSFLW